MGEGEQLSDGELLRIAESVKSKNGKIPDYLSEDDKKTVEELIDILYARDKAVKLYFTKLNYLDALKRAQDLKAAQEAKKLRAIKRWGNYKEYALKAAQIKQSAQAATNYLYTAYVAASESLKPAVVSLGNGLFICLDSRPSKRKIAVKLKDPPTADGREAIGYEPAGRYIRARVYRDFGSDELPLGKTMSQEERLALEAELKRTRSPFVFKAFTFSVKAKDAAVTNLLANTEALGDISRKLSEEMDRRAEEQRKAALSIRGKAYGYQTEEYYEAMRDVPIKKERLRLASVWYIIAAMGDLFCQLGQSLMNG